MKFPKKTLDDLTDLKGKIVLTRVDFNVPLDSSQGVTDSTRLEAAAPTIKRIIELGGIPLLMSHMGRPAGQVVEELRLAPVVEPLSRLLGCPVKAARDTVGESARQMIDSLQPGEVGLLENLRFHSEEKQNDREFSRELASLGDLYLNDAFGTAHRAHASITGVTEFLSPAVGGYLIEAEFEKLTEVRDNPERPLMVLLGGAKLADKLPVIKHFLEQAEVVMVGGAMAYTFALARGNSVGESRVEPDFVDEARDILENRDRFKGELLLPVDNLILDTTSDGQRIKTTTTDSIDEGWEGMDIGPKTVEKFCQQLESAGTVFWNGPFGAFDYDERFARGTRKIAEKLAGLEAKVVVGGGDSASAVKQSGFADQLYHISTGGGASLQLVRGVELPGFKVLDDK